MKRDERDCLCPGAVKLAKGQPHPTTKLPVDEPGWYSNDPTVECPVHPHGYDRGTGSNE